MKLQTCAHEKEQAKNEGYDCPLLCELNKMKSYVSFEKT